MLAAITCAAQDVQSQNRLLSLELIRWARPPGSSRKDGVPAESYPREPRRTRPHFAQRDYAHGHPWGSDADQFFSASTGVVAVLTTKGDSRQDWIAATRHCSVSCCTPPPTASARPSTPRRWRCSTCGSFCARSCARRSTLR
ncbi:hypothetical protein ACFQX6_13390 [Streptosporangium lutulentum]